MYNVLWSGGYLPLPLSSASGAVPQYGNGWEPLFISESGVPSYWWFLVDHFNCFWHETGVPVFLVDRESALARCDSRFSLLKEIFNESHLQAWRCFRSSIQMSRGEIFNIELSGVWQKEMCASVENFQAYTNDCLSVFDISNGGWRKKSAEQKKQVCATLVADNKILATTLFGHRIDRGKLHPLGPDDALQNK
jgi:hypothetical protein